MGLTSRLFNSGVRMEMIDHDSSILQMTVQLKQSIIHTILSQTSADKKVRYIKTGSVLHVSYYFAFKCLLKLTSQFTISLGNLY